MRKPILLAIVLLLVVGGPAYAHSPGSDATEPAESTDPPTGESVSGDHTSATNPAAHWECTRNDTASASMPLLPIDAVAAPAGVPPGGVPICQFGFNPVFHEHRVMAILKRYDGFKDRNTGQACLGPCQISMSTSQTVGYGWGASISFDRGPVSATVGYNVSWSSSRTYTFTFNVPSGKTRTLMYRDWYHTTTMTVRTTYYGSIPVSQNGTAWAGKWFKRVYYIA